MIALHMREIHLGLASVLRFYRFLTIRAMFYRSTTGTDTRPVLQLMRFLLMLYGSDARQVRAAEEGIGGEVATAVQLRADLKPLREHVLLQRRA